MLYSLSGTQGSGKSTIISDLSNLGYNTIERKTSRSVLKDWNMDLSWIYSDSDLMKDFQDEILKRKYLDEQSAIESSEIWFTDRSYVDLLVYSCIILGHNSQNKDWLDLYYNKCNKYQKLYSKIFYISPLPFVTDDGTRGNSMVYNTLVDSAISKFLYKMNRSKIIDIESIDHDIRVKQILKNINKSEIYTNDG